MKESTDDTFLMDTTESNGVSEEENELLEEENSQLIMASKMAQKELKKWVLRKQGNTRKLQNKEVFETLVQMMCQGDLVLKQDLSATYTLRYPVMGEVDGQERMVLDQLKFKNRLKYTEVKHILKTVDDDDQMGSGLAYTAGLTGVSLKILEQMDMSDLTKVQSVAVFFIT